MSNEDQHVLRARTAAEEYQRVLNAWAEASGLDVRKVFEVGVRYSLTGCRECTAEDPSLDVTVVYEDSSGSRCSVWIYDDAKTVRSLAAMLAELAPIVEKENPR
jgi:hypothetical protein